MDTTELHVFFDVWEKAYAGVVYLRSQCPLGEVNVHLLTSKTKVGPIISRPLEGL